MKYDTDEMADYFRSHLSYCEESGLMYWVKKPSNRVNIGELAGTVNRQGYLVVTVRRQKIQGHRVAWLLHHGKWPKHQIDHVDGNRSNNRISNLRDATHVQNMQNTAMFRNNRSGCMGVRWNNKSSRWVSFIGHGGKRISLGTHTSLLEAAARRKSREISLGYHPNHGRVATNTGAQQHH